MYQYLCACMHAKSLQSCPDLCNPTDCCPPGFSVHGILQARNTGVNCHALLQGIFPTRHRTLVSQRFLRQRAGSLLLVPPAKPVSVSTSLITHWMKTISFYYCSYSRGKPAGVSDFSWGGLWICSESWIGLQLGCLSPLYLGLAG